MTAPHAACALSTTEPPTCLLCAAQELRRILHEHVGGSAAPWLRWLLRFGLLFSGDAYATTARRLRWLAADLGRGFACELSQEPECVPRSSCPLHPEAPCSVGIR